MVLENFFDTIFGPILNLPNPFGLLIISFLLTLLITVIYKYMTDQELMKTLKDDIKVLQKKMKELKEEPAKMMAVQKEAMQKNMKYMMHSMKPTLITFIPIILIFGWLRKYYTALGNPEIFMGLSWIWTYIIFSIIISISLRKILKVH